MIARKLRLTYSGDGAALQSIRGTGPPAEWKIEPATAVWLGALCDAFWFAALAAAAVGPAGFRGWPPGTAPLLLGPLLTFFALHVVLLGGERYHAPEVPFLAVLAACGLDRVLGALRRVTSPAPRSTYPTLC